jgi:signal transduction histidine kinase
MREYSCVRAQQVPNFPKAPRPQSIYWSKRGRGPQWKPDKLSYEFKSMVFRQVTESLTNVERHAAATRVLLSVKAVNGAVHGLVIDNGRGFVVSERDRLPGHLGLLALNERSLLAGGWTKIECEPGLGTRIEFWMPIA